MKFSKKLVIVIIVLISAFILAMMITYWCMGDVPEPLIAAVAAMATAEGGFLMLIKNTDTKHSDYEDFGQEDPEDNDKEENQE